MLSLDTSQAYWAAESRGLREALRRGMVRGTINGATALWRLLGSCAPMDSFGILMFHRISPRLRGVRQPSINVTPRRFRLQLEGLLKLGFRFESLETMIARSAQKEPIPEKTAVVTFDDGFANVAVHALPILQDLQIPATVFLNTAYIGRGGPFPFDHWGLKYHRRLPVECYLPADWRQCEQLAASGLVALGAHTHSHQDFRGRATAFAEDLEICLEMLRDRLGIVRPTFALPYGTPRLGFADPAFLQAARDLGTTCTLTTQPQLVVSGDDPYGWGRLNAFAWDSPASLAARLLNWYGWARGVLARPQTTQHQTTQHQTAWTAGRPLEEPADWHARPKGDSVPQIPRLPWRDERDERDERDDCHQDTSNAPLSSRPLISVIVPTFNRAEWLGEALDSLVRLETEDRFDFEIVVVNNNSSDDTESVLTAWASRFPDQIRWFVQTKSGDAPTRNLGISKARGTWLAFFDDDQFANPRWLLELLLGAQESGAKVVGGPVLLDMPPEELEALGHFCRIALREIKFYSHPQYYRAQHLPGTGNALVHRELFQRVGMFDESMKRGGSDSDFFLRARINGERIWYNPAASIRHRIPEVRLTPQFFRWDAWSGGSGQAEFDYQRRGTLGMLLFGALRVGQTCGSHWPRIAWNRWRGNSAEVLSWQTRAWRTEGYVRAGMRLLAPRWFPQHDFFEALEFRKGREVGDDDQGELP